MKAILSLITPFVVVFLLISCATPGNKIPRKYDLDRQLARINKITGLPAESARSEHFKAKILTWQEQLRKQWSENPNDPRDRQQQLASDRPLYSANYEVSKVYEQSLIVRDGPDKNYILVLHWPVPKILSDIDIKIITATTTSINAKTDFVLIGENKMCPIERIYIIGDDEYAKVIKGQLLGLPKK